MEALGHVPSPKSGTGSRHVYIVQDGHIRRIHSRPTRIHTHTL